MNTTVQAILLGCLLIITANILTLPDEIKRDLRELFTFYKFIWRAYQ